MNPIFSLRNVSLFYRGLDNVSTPALTDLNFDIYQNEFLIIVGPNGCGKSSLAKLLAGLADHFEGVLMYKGAAVTAYSRRCFDDVALTIQEPQNQILMPTVHEELSFPLEIRGFGKNEIAGKIRETASLFGITDILHAETDRLSGGQISIVAMAAAAIVDPQVIIFDEPDSHFDWRARNAFENYLALCRGKKTIIVITQYPGFGVAADRMAIMKSGKIVAAGKPAELLEDKAFLIGYSLHSGDFAKDMGRRTGKGSSTGKRPLLSLSEVDYSYESGGFALKRISLDICEGEKVGIVGPIGSGKTTLGLLICGVLKADSGTVFLDNRPLGEYAPDTLRRMVTMALQFPERALIENTVRNDILFGPRQLGMENLEQIAESLLASFSIEELADRNPLGLSGGQKRKAALAGVFAMNCRLIVLDEPTASLDPASAADLAAVIGADPTTAFVIIGHDLPFLCRVCDRIAGIEDGRLAFDVSVDEFAGKYGRI